MAYRHMKRCSTLLFTREMKIKTTTDKVITCKTKLKIKQNKIQKQQWVSFPSHQSGWPSSESVQTTNSGEGVETRDPSYTVGGNVGWCSGDSVHCGKQCRGPSENYSQNHHVTQQSHSWAYTQTKLWFKKIGLPWGLSGKEATCQVGDTGSIPDLGTSHMLRGS